jgi:hypothetical protein
LKRNIKRRHTTETEGHKQAEREQSRLLPPMVSTPSMSDHCGELADIVLHTIAPEAPPGQISTISDREIEECIEVSAIALCWHLVGRGYLFALNRRKTGQMPSPPHKGSS